MPDLFSILTSLSWPFAIAIAWLVGEFGQRWTGLPRISFYGLAGFALAYTQAGVLPAPSAENQVALLADIAFGLILFELGYRINPRWLRINPWIGVAGLVEALATFAAVYFIAVGFGTAHLTALMLAALSMATSPATVVRVINEQGSAGQVTERALHLSAQNCVLAVFAFNVVLGFWIFRTSEDLGDALWHSLVVLIVSALAGALLGVVVPGVLHAVGQARDATAAFAISVLLLVALTYTFRLSPVVATLAFGLTARHRRVALSQAQRNFGPLGEILTVLLFVFAASTLDWRRVVAGAGLALALVGARLFTKTAGVALFAHLSGVTWRKGALTGLALAPLSVFVILLLEQARHSGVPVVDELGAMAAVTMLLEVFSPVIIQRALVWAQEAPEKTRAG